MARSHTKAIDQLAVADHAKLLIDLLDIAQHACLQWSDELLRMGAITGAQTLLERASAAYDLRLRLEVGIAATDNEVEK